MAAVSFTNIFDIINIPLGFVLRFCYQLTSNYGLAIILFTLIIRVVLVPLAIKQQKSMAHTVRLQPKIEALQKKHGKDKQKLQEAQMKLYQEEGANPMGGCLPLVVQLPVLYGLYNVIYHPLLYIVQLSVNVKNRVVYDRSFDGARLADFHLSAHPDFVLSVFFHTGLADHAHQ